MTRLEDVCNIGKEVGCKTIGQAINFIVDHFWAYVPMKEEAAAFVDKLYNEVENRGLKAIDSIDKVI